MLSLVAGMAYAMDTDKQMTLSDVRELGKEMQKQGADPIAAACTLHFLADSVAERLGREMAALPTPEARAEFWKRYNH